MHITLIAGVAGAAGIAFSAVAASLPPGTSPAFDEQVVMPIGTTAAIDALPGDGLHAVRVLRYTMDGKIRPLLFWLGQNDIGFARVIWREGERGARGYELLVGTDPAKAPRALNRWGYIAEEAVGANGALLALMTGADEASYDEATANPARPSAGRDFRAIRSELRGSTSTWQIARVETAANFCVHDVDAALDRVRRETAAAARQEDRAPDGSRSGFLVALAELIDRGAGTAASQRGSRGKAVREPVRFVFGRSVYELRLRDMQPGSLVVGGQPTPIVRSSFEIRTVATDARTHFDVTFGSAGPLLNVPVAIEWQPRWWLKVGLRLDPSRS
jgi:hypothetical protein